MYSRFFQFLLLLLSWMLLSAAETPADVALPPGLIKPYSSTPPHVSCYLSDKTVIVYLHTPGPCDYTVALYDEDGKALDGPASGSSQRFGNQTLSVRTQVPELKKGESRQLRYQAQGRLYNYQAVPLAGEDDSALLRLGRNMLANIDLADPSTFRYELKDKKGKTFAFDLPVVLMADDHGLTVQCKH
ncbi:MAG: hypothetical protein J5846_10265 [Desulfovibrio sp.]|nr:hypothetical protein [Desulfovibrio sp.]